MRIAIASGKGGTGKTTIAANLAYVAAALDEGAAYIDCDAEEPNGHIFLKPRISGAEKVTVPVPEVDEQKCISCGKCSKICRFNAITLIADKVLVFSELCHGCGGCSLICPTEAIEEIERPIGKVEYGAVPFDEAEGHSTDTPGADGPRAGGNRELFFAHGLLDVGEAIVTPVIRKIKRFIPDQGLTIIDAPPGSSCPMVESVNGSDYVVLVTEPTPFGLNDLRIAVETVKIMGLPTGVVINRSDIGNSEVLEYCRSEGLEILAEIPDSRELAEIYSRGEVISEKLPFFRSLMSELVEKIIKRISDRN